jgi:hypothetical protein
MFSSWVSEIISIPKRTNRAPRRHPRRRAIVHRRLDLVLGGPGDLRGKLICEYRNIQADQQTLLKLRYFLETQSVVPMPSLQLSKTAVPHFPEELQRASEGQKSSNHRR